MQTITLRFSPEEIELFEKLAAAEQITINHLIQQMFDEIVGKLKPEN